MKADAGEAIRVPDPEERPVVPVEFAGRCLGLGRSSSYKAAKSGELPVIRMGGRMVVPTAELRRMLGLPISGPGSDQRSVA